MRLWGSLLFETRASVERLRYISEQAQRSPPYFSFAPFDFAVSDALLPEFCRVVPTPAILESCRLTIAAAKRVDFFQRVAGAAETVATEAAARTKGAAFAKDAIDKGIVERYNALVDKANEVATAIFLGGEGGAALIERMLPARIDPAAAVDHSLF